MINMEETFYMMKDILLRLGEKGEAISRPTFQEYERLGIIKAPSRYAIISNGKKVRLYTKEEVEQNADRIIAYIKQKRAKTLL